MALQGEGQRVPSGLRSAFVNCATNAPVGGVDVDRAEELDLRAERLLDLEEDEVDAALELLGARALRAANARTRTGCACGRCGRARSCP